MHSVFCPLFVRFVSGVCVLDRFRFHDSSIVELDQVQN